MVVMHVAGLTLDEQTKAPILVLKNVHGSEVLPIWIGAMEAMAISVVLNEVAVPRPLTHDLMLRTLEESGTVLQGVEIVALREGTYFAVLSLGVGESTHRVDCRPSDAVALALRAQVPILVHDHVLETALRENLRPSTEPATEEERERLQEPADAAAEMVRASRGMGQGRPSGLRTGNKSADTAARAARASGEPQDDESLADLLRQMEPDIKTKM